MQPNAPWCDDYKCEFLLGNRKHCDPLTITDFASRDLLTCEALLRTQEKFAFTVFERTFKEFGRPQVIRHNGVPFASAHAIYGPSKLASGSCDSAFRSNAFSLAVRNTTDGTSACI